MNKERISHFPISFFSIPLGLFGYTVFIEKYLRLLPSSLSPSFSLLFFGFSFCIFLFLIILFLQKALFFPQKIRQDFFHPIKSSFFATISVSILLSSIAIFPFSEILSFIFWVVGTTFHLFFTLAILSIWMHKTNFTIEHMNPSWFIPAVGNLLIPITGSRLGFEDISWFFLAIGILFWILLLSIFFNRIIFHQPLPEKLLPTLFILIAPPSVLCISLFSLTQNQEFPLSILVSFYNIGLFFALLLFVQIPIFKKIAFSLSWWAYSFPLAALGIASTLLYQLTHNTYYFSFATFLLLCLTTLLLFLGIKTLSAVRSKKICVQE